MASNPEAVPRKRDEETGEFRRAYPLEAFLEALEEEGGMASTKEITDIVGCTNALTYQRLRDLEDDDEVTSRKVANARLWMLPDEAGDDR